MAMTYSSLLAGQLVSEYPFIYLMSKLPLTKFVGGTMYVLTHESKLNVSRAPI